MHKLYALITLVLFVSACQMSDMLEPDLNKQSNEASNDQSITIDLEEFFWNALSQQCGHTFNGKSSFPDNSKDSFYGKPLIAEFANCTETEIRVPFAVGNNKSRTWIFTKLDNGKLQLKHQHLHADGSVDEVSNYGGISDGGDLEFTGNSKILHMHFPADSFTQQLLPEASSNVWTIELVMHDDSIRDFMTYNLYRHNKKRFIARLDKVK